MTRPNTGTQQIAYN